MDVFVESVRHHCDGMHVAPGAAASCGKCVDLYGISTRDTNGRFRSVDAMQEDLDEQAEGSFSWSACDTCGTTLGGSRHEAHGWIEKDLVHLAICMDCLFYFANGDVPEKWEQYPTR